MKVGNRLDELVPGERGGLLNLVEVGCWRSEPVQGRAKPMLESSAVSAPAREGTADEEVDRDGGSGGQIDPPVQDRLIRSGRLAINVAPRVKRQGELDRRIAGEFAIGMAVPAVDRQQGADLVVPAQTDVADAAIDLSLHIDGDHGGARLAPLVGDPKPLDVLARGSFAPLVFRE